MKKMVMLMGVALMMPPMLWAKCDEVARVFDVTICHEEIAIPKINRAGYEMPDEQHKKQENARLLAKIRQIAIEKTLTKESYIPTEDEVMSFVEFSEKSKELASKHNQELINFIEGLLKKNRYNARNQQQLESALATYKISVQMEKKRKEGDRLRDEDMRKRFGEEAVQQMHARLKETPKKIAKQWVSAWKTNKALFEHYGGRVIFQQAGIEPIDAYKNLLSDMKIKGKLQVLNPVYKDVLTEFERYLAMGHNTLSESGEHYFNRPYWQTNDLEKSHREAVQGYQNIPHE